MAKSIELGVKLVPGIDQKQLARITELLNKAGNVEGKVTLDDSELQEAAGIIQDFLKGASEEIQLAIDTSQITDAEDLFESFREEMGQLVDEMVFPTPPDVSDALNELAVLSDEWNDVKAAVEAAYDEQVQLLEALEAAGKTDTPDYAEVTANLEAAEKVLQRIADDEKRAFAESEKAANEAFKGKKAAAEAALKDQLTIIARLKSEGADSPDIAPDFDNAVAEAKRLKAELESIADAEREAAKAAGLIEDSLQDGIAETKAKAQKSLQEQLTLITKMKVEGKDAGPDFDNAVAEAKKLKKAIEDISAAEQEAVDILDKPDGFDFLANVEALNQLAEGFGAAAEQGEEYRNSLNKLSAVTGATGAELEALQKQAEDLFVSGVGESAGQAVEIVGQAKTTFGKIFDGDDLAQITGNVAKLGQAFDKEFGEIANRSTQFAKTFGLSATETSNLLALGLRDANTAADDFLDTLGEYSGLLKQAGFSAEEFVGVLKTGADNASFTTDKIADAIKETRIRLMEGDIQNELQGVVDDMGTRLPDALGKTLKGIEAAGKAGQLSVKDVLIQSTQAIEKEFESGNIDELMRTKLQRAFAGTPAEDLGGELYARIFGAPIDENAIRAKAAAASASITSAMGNNTIFDGFSKKLDIIQQKAASAMLPLEKGIKAAGSAGVGLLAIKQLLPEKAVDALKNKFEGLAKTVGGKLTPALSKLGPMLMNPYVLATAAAAAGLTYFFTQTEKGKAIWGQLTAKAEEFYAKVKPLLIAIGKFFEVYIGAAIDIASAEIEALASILGGLVEGLFTLLSKVAGFFGLMKQGGGEAAVSIEEITGVVEKLTLGFEAVATTVAEFFKNTGDAIGLLLSGDFSGFAKKISTAYSDATAKGAEAVQKRLDEINTEKLQAKIADGFVIKEKLDKNNAIGELVEKFKNAKDGVQKQNLAKLIADQVPGAVKGVETVVDTATRKTTEVFDISLEAAEKYVKDQDDILSKQGQGSKDAFVELFAKQADQFDKSKQKLRELGEEIANPKPGENVEELLKKYREQEKEVEKNADALGKLADEGAGIGITGDEIEKIGKKAKLSDKEAQGLNGTFVVMKQKMKDAKVEMNALATAFNTGLQNAQNAVGQTTAAFAQAALEAKRLKGELAKTDDPEKRKEIQRDIEAVNKAADEAKIKGREAQKTALQYQEEQIRANHAIGTDAKSSLQTAQQRIALNSTQADYDLRAFKLMQDMQIIEQKRQRTSTDDLISSKQELATSEQKLNFMLRQYHVAGNNREEQAKIVEELRKQIKETGKIDESVLKERLIKVGVRAQEGFDGALRAIKDEVLGAVLDVEEKAQVVVQLQAQVSISFDELVQMQKDLDRRHLELNIELGLKNQADLARFVEQDVEALQLKFDKEGEKIQQINDAILVSQKTAADATTDASRQVAEAQVLILQQTLTDSLKVQTDLQGQILDKQAEVKSTYQAYYDGLLNDLQAAQDKETAKLTEQGEKRLELLQHYLDVESALRSESADDEASQQAEELERIAAERAKILDEQAQAELAALDETHSAGLLKERDYQEEKLRITKEAEDRKAEADAQAQAEREKAEREHQKKLLIIQKQAEGTARLAELQKTRAELTKQTEDLKAKIVIAQQAYNANATTENKKQLDDLKKQLETTQTILATKGTEIGVTAELTGQTVGDAINQMFNGSSEQVADSFRSLFATVAGALKEMLSAFVLEWVLSPGVAGALVTAGGPLGVFGAAVALPAIKALVSGVVGAIANPVIEGLLSFSTGGRVDSPTMAIVGDAARLGGSNREWIFRDEQLNAVIDSAIMRSSAILGERISLLEEAIVGERILGKVSGEDILLISRRTEQRRKDRTIGS